MIRLSTTEHARDFSDEEVLRRSKSEPWLFAVLLERYQAAFLRKAESILKSREDSEEVVQDAFTKIYVNAHRFSPEEGAKFSSWAYAIVINTALTRYQKLKKEHARTTHLSDEGWTFQGEETLHSGFEEKRDAIDRILEKLPGHFAAVLRLHFLERWPQKDIAELMGEELGTVKARIHRAKEAFRKEEQLLEEI